MNDLPTLEEVIDLIKTEQVPTDMGVALLVAKNVHLQAILQFDADSFANIVCCENAEMIVPMDDHFELVNYPIQLSKNGVRLSQDEVATQLRADINQLDFIDLPEGVVFDH